MSSRKKLYRKGNRILLKKLSYVKYFNNFNERINVEFRYKKEIALKEIEEGKKTRPIIVLWENDNHNKIIAFSTSTKKNKKTIKNNFVYKETIWKPEVLLINKNTFLASRSIQEKIDHKELDKYVAWLKKHKKKTFAELERQLGNVEYEVKINNLKKNINRP